MLLLFIIVIPAGLKYLTDKRHFSTVAANLIGTKISIVILCVGALAVSMSKTIWLFIPGRKQSVFLDSQIDINAQRSPSLYLGTGCPCSFFHCSHRQNLVELESRIMAKDIAPLGLSKLLAH